MLAFKIDVPLIYENIKIIAIYTMIRMIEMVICTN